MGCSNLVAGKKEIELNPEEIIFKTKFEKFVHKLKKMKEKESDEKYIQDIDW